MSWNHALNNKALEGHTLGLERIVSGRETDFQAHFFFVASSTLKRKPFKNTVVVEERRYGLKLALVGEQPY